MFKVINEIINMQKWKPIETIKLNWEENDVKIQFEAFYFLIELKFIEFQVEDLFKGWLARWSQVYGANKIT